jgi:hypothetical protein
VNSLRGTLADQGTRSPHGIMRIVRAVSKRRADHMQRSAGRAMGAVASRKKLAIALQVDPSNVSRRTSGEQPRSAIGAAKADAYLLESSDVDASFMVVEIKSAQAQAKLRRLTLDELRSTLTHELIEETDAQSAADPVQARFALSQDKALRQRVRDASAAHAARLERITALIDEIDFREAGGR